MTGFLDITRAAGFLCRSPRWIRGRLHEIPHYKAGQILFRQSDLEQYMEKFRVEPKEVDIQVLVDRICGKSKLGMPMKIGRGRERVEERNIVAQGPNVSQGKALVSGLDLLPITQMMG